MITDRVVLEDIRSSWNTVRISQEMIQTNLNVAFAFGGAQSHNFKNLAYSLILIFAFSVIEDALRQLEDQGVFSAKNRQLGTLMHASKSALPWVAFQFVDEGRERRNDVAHKREYLERADCWKYIDAIENELIAWRILLGKAQATYTITVTPTS